MAQPLTSREMDMLEFERHPPRTAGRKDHLIRQLFPDWLPTRYYQVLTHLIDRPEAQAYAPDVVRRLQSMRARGRRGARDVPSGAVSELDGPPL